MSNPPNPAAAGEQLPVPSTLSETLDYDSPYLRVVRAVKRMPSGEEATFYLRHEADVVVCLPVTPDGDIVLVEEYRHGPGQWLFEIPGGNADPGEAAGTTAAREVLEETGYAGDVRHLCTTWISAYSTARKHIYLMRGAKRVGPPQAAASDLFRVSPVSLDRFEAVVRSGQLTDLDAGLACLDALRGDAASSKDAAC